MYLRYYYREGMRYAVDLELDSWNAIVGLSVTPGKRRTKKNVATEAYVAESSNAYDLPTATGLARASNAASRHLGLPEYPNIQSACVDNIKNHHRQRTQCCL